MLTSYLAVFARLFPKRAVFTLINIAGLAASRKPVLALRYE